MKAIRLDEKLMVRLYVNERLTIEQVAEKLGTNYCVVWRRLEKLGISRRSNQEAHIGLTVGPANGTWKGGRVTDPNRGYVRIRVGRTYVKEHRLIMEQVLGRKLKRGEIVHHKDHNRSNNHPSNLEILSSQSEHLKLHWKEESVRSRSVSASK